MAEETATRLTCPAKPSRNVKEVICLSQLHFGLGIAVKLSRKFDILEEA